MAAAALIPVGLYLHTSYEPDAEYVDGQIEKRPTGEFEHSAWQAAIQRWFFRHEDEWNLLVCPELRVQVSSSRFRVPDVTILDRALPREPVATHPPLAVFEVLSPEDSHTRLMRKLGDYASMGIPAIWVIDPESGAFEQFVGGNLLRRDEFCLKERAISFATADIASLVRR